MRKQAICHPSLPAYGRTMCKACYQRDYYAGLGPEKLRAYRRAYRMRHPEAISLRKAYEIGISGAQYDAMFVAQNGLCAICSEPNNKLNVDHDHAGGEVRGLLCRRCNLGLGQFRDNPEFLRRAEQYITREAK